MPFRLEKQIRRRKTFTAKESLPLGMLVEVIGVPEEGKYEVRDLSNYCIFTIDVETFNEHFRRFL